MFKEKTKLPHPVAGQKTDLLEIFRSKDGTYMGFGTDIDDRQFRGDLEVKHIAGGKGISLKFKAVGMSGTEFNKHTHLYNEDTVLYNEEYGTIAFDTDNRLSLWVISSNIPTMVKFGLRRYREVSKDKHIFIFGFGEPDDGSVFREEITIELTGDNDFAYNYSWGQSDGMFIARWSAILKRIINN